MSVINVPVVHYYALYWYKPALFKVERSVENCVVYDKRVQALPLRPYCFGHVLRLRRATRLGHLGKGWRVGIERFLAELMGSSTQAYR